MATRSTSACQQIYIVAAAGELATGCPYLPDGNPASGPKFDHKLAWFERLHKYGKTLIAADAPFIMAGDSNVMPTYLDVDAPERWRDDALFRPEVRNAYAELVTLGWQDALRHLYPGKRIYTFWQYFRKAFARDAGPRVYHLLLNPSLQNRLVAGGVARAVPSWENTTDHAPAWIELEDIAPSRLRRQARG
jgi:exodeoxyribonuclease-3